MTDAPAFRVPRSRAFETHRSLRLEILAALEPVLFGTMRDAYAVRGAFEREFARVIGFDHAVAVHSGTMGLVIALRACGVGVGDEVITVGNSDISTTAAVRHVGAIPVLCDVQRSDYTLDVRLVEALITPKTRALLPVDLHGHPADVKALRALADGHGLKIIEDAALATGARDHGQPVGAFADAAVFSFAPFKPLGSVGNGAVITTNDPHTAERLDWFAHYGHTSSSSAPAGHQEYVEEGYNAPLDPLQAALLSVKLSHLAAWTTRRREIAALYEASLRGTNAHLPSFRPESAPTFRSYCICVPDRERVYVELLRAGVEVVLHYTPPAYQHPVYGGQMRGANALPATDQLARELICLPVTPELTDEEVLYAAEAVREALN